MRNWLWILVASLFILFPFGSVRAQWLWDVETAVISKGAGTYTSLALDSEGHAHIAYRALGTYTLRYMTNASGLWVSEDLRANCSGYTSLAVDKSGAVHISFYSSGALKYATNRGGAWAIRTLDDEGNAGNYSSLAIDSQGRVHISYHDDDMGSLKYATNAGGSWVTATLDSTGYSGSYTGLAIDPQDHVHIACYREPIDDPESGELLHVTNASGAWIAESVDEATMVGRHADIACDATGILHISYYDGNEHCLRHATNASGSWQCQAIDATANVGAYTCIAADRQGKVHISYYDYSNQDPKYATNASGSWTMETVDGFMYENRGRYTGIAVDGDGNRYITYERNATPTCLMLATRLASYWQGQVLDDTLGDSGLGSYAALALDSQDRASIGMQASYHLRLVTQTPTGWAMTRLVDGGNVGAYCNLLIDATDHLHFAYMDSLNEKSTYLSNESGAWQSATLPSGMFNSSVCLAQEANGTMHVAYKSTDRWMTSTLRYLNNASGSWVSQDLMDPGFYGSNTSMAIDGQGKVHIGLYDNNGNVRYVTNASGAWAAFTIWSTGSGLNDAESKRRSTSIVVDEADAAHLAFYDRAAKTLKHAVIASGTWEVETIDASGDMGQYVSLARDPEGNLVAAYYDATDGALRYATKTSEGWRAETVDTSGNVGLYPSLRLTSTGAPRIAYYDSTNRALKYASGRQAPPPAQLWVVY